MEAWSETRTVFLPFAPKTVSYILQWKSMELLLVLGDQEGMAIRMDSPMRPVVLGKETTTTTTMMIETTEQQHESQHNNRLWIRRFQVLPIQLPSSTTFMGQRLLAASSTGVQPPAVLRIRNWNQRQDH
jgi:hypothetical protein